jgi:methanogenic corrinoid protein MtbC1
MNELVMAMKDLKEDQVVEEVQAKLRGKEDPMAILQDLQEGMRLVGEEFQKGIYFLSELIMSAQIFQQAVDILGEKLTETTAVPKYGTFVIGTVQGDIHDIGKNIVATLLACQGFKVVDLGVDVPAEKFVEAVKEHKPSVLGLSGLLTVAFDSMKNIVDSIDQAGLRSSLPILIGGATIDQNTCNFVGADGFCVDANEAVLAAQKLSGGAS